LLAVAQKTFDGADIRIQSCVREGVAPIDSVFLHYKVNGGAEQVVGMVGEANRWGRQIVFGR